MRRRTLLAATACGAALGVVPAALAAQHPAVSCATIVAEARASLSTSASTRGGSFEVSCKDGGVVTVTGTALIYISRYVSEAVGKVAGVKRVINRVKV